MLSFTLGSIYTYSSQTKTIQRLKDKYMTWKNNFNKHNRKHVSAFGGKIMALSGFKSVIGTNKIIMIPKYMQFHSVSHFVIHFSGFIKFQLSSILFNYWEVRVSL